MKISSPNLRLRTPQLSDLQAMLRWENDESHWHVSETEQAFDEETLRAFIMSEHDLHVHQQLRLMMETLDGRLVGMVDLFAFEPKHQRLSLGIFVDKQFRKRGFGKEAILAVSNYCFDTLGLHQQTCEVGASNAESIALFEGCGFSQIAQLPQWRKMGSAWEDVLLFTKIAVGK